MREPIFDCAPQFCDGAIPPGDWEGIPFWAVLILLILLSLLIVSFLQPKKDTPATLKKAVDDALAEFEGQAATWGDPKAERAFANARRKVAGVIDKYKAPDPI